MKSNSMFSEPLISSSVMSHTYTHTKNKNKTKQKKTTEKPKNFKSNKHGKLDKQL